MSGLIIATLVVQIILSLILVVVVLFQSGNQTGLSGSIAGGAETFFGKNKGRTLDAKLKKWTSVVAVLFLVTSIALSFMVSNEQKKNAAETAPTNVDMDVSALTGETAPIDVVPVEGETAPAEGEVAPAEGETAPVDVVPVEGEAVPAE